jgi:hypothetical protein
MALSPECHCEEPQATKESVAARLLSEIASPRSQ